MTHHDKDDSEVGAERKRLSDFKSASSLIHSLAVAEVQRANRRDTDQVFELVNKAFSVEVGNQGIAYREAQDHTVVIPHFHALLTSKSNIQNNKILHISSDQ